MIAKENAIVEITGWISEARDTLGIKTVRRTPSSPASSDDFTAVFIHEGDDTIIKYSSTRTGYPVTRKGEVAFEMWTKKGVDVRALYRALRTLLFTKSLSVPVDIREIKTFGPFNGGVPHTRTMQLIVGLTYKDVGPGVS